MSFLRDLALAAAISAVVIPASLGIAWALVRLGLEQPV